MQQVLIVAYSAHLLFYINIRNIVTIEFILKGHPSSAKTEVAKTQQPAQKSAKINAGRIQFFSIKSFKYFMNCYLLFIIFEFHLLFL